MIKRYSQDSDYRLYECADGELVKYDDVEFLLFPSDDLLERLKAAKEKTGMLTSEMARAAVDAYLRGLGV